MGINAVKGVEIGAGFAAVTDLGSQHGDELLPDGFVGNRAGGVLGGISSGQDIEVSIAVKPTSSIRLPRRTITRAGVADRHRNPRTARSLCRHPCDTDRRSDAGTGAHGPCAAASCTERRRPSRHRAASRPLFVVLMPRDALPQPPDWRLGALFAAYFGLAGLLAPYMPLYFQARGLDAFQIGLSGSARPGHARDRPQPVGIPRRPCHAPHPDPAQRPPLR